jgi:hypothetical protein
MKIEDVQMKHEDRLMAIPGVVGVGITELDGKPAIAVMVSQLTPELQQRLPQDLEGFAVKIDEVGVISAQKLGPRK